MFTPLNVREFQKQCSVYIRIQKIKINNIYKMGNKYKSEIRKGEIKPNEKKR